MGLINFSVMGVSKFQLGKTVMSEADIYNYDIDDEFHYIGNYYSFSSSYTAIDEINKIIDKKLNEGVISYSISYLRHETHTDYQNPESSIDTVYKGAFIQNVDITTPQVYFPEEATADYNSGWGEGGYWQDYWVNNRLNINSMYENYYYSNDQDGCWEPIIYKRSSKYLPYGYAEGLGLIGWQDIDGLSQKYMAYYKKGEETWGTPLVITSTSALEVNKLNVYPNPVKAGGMVYIEGVTSQILVSITTMAGELVSNVIYTENGIVIPKNTPAGIYFITLQGNGAERIVRKVIVLN